MRAASVIVLLGFVTSGCTTEMIMAGYFKSNGTVYKGAKGRTEVLFFSINGAALPESEHERKHFAALDDWLREQKLCRRGYVKLNHNAKVQTPPDLGSTLEPVDARTMNITIACK
jgi:hypothetical protein